MTRGFQPDPLVEHAATVEIAAALKHWQISERKARRVVQEWMDRGARAQVIANELGMSRATLYRWLATEDE